MRWLHLIWGAIGGGAVLVAALAYGIFKFTEEPEFGSIIGLGAIFLGALVALGVFSFSVVVAVVSGRQRAAKQRSGSRGIR